MDVGCFHLSLSQTGEGINLMHTWESFPRSELGILL